MKKKSVPLSACALPVAPASLSGGKIVTVQLPPNLRSYEIIVGDNILAEAGALIHLRLGRRRCVIITDHNVSPFYQQRLEAVLAASGHTLLPAIVVPAGDSTKNFDMLQDVLNQLFERSADRHTLAIVLGGGVVGDLAGFAASLFMRGIDFVQIPTTLLAQVDSSVGGKTGINTAHGKNTVGSFYQPRLVLADVTTLDSLPEREMKAGYVELVKHGLILDAGFFQWCQAHGSKLLRGDREAQIYAISKSCEHKARVVMVDERETHERALLNLGHTFAHALETITGYSSRLLHGEAVAVGISMAFRLSAGLGLCPQKDADMVQEHFRQVGIPVNPPPFTYDIDRLMELMGKDKKSRSGKLTLILARGIGQAFISNDVNPSPVRTLWESVVA